MSRKEKGKTPMHDMINWTPYVEGKLITDEHKRNLDKLDTDEERRLSIILENIPTFVDIFKHILVKIHNNEITKYILKILVHCFGKSKRFLVGYCSKGETCYESLLENLDNEDEELVRLGYSLILRALFRVNPKNVKVQIHRLLTITYENIRRFFNNVNMVLTLIQVLMNITKDRNNRGLVISSGGLKYIIAILQRYQHNIQIEYSSCFCVWTLSFIDKTVESEIQNYITQQKVVFMKHMKILPIMHDILNKQQKEKVKRIILMTFQNFLESPDILRVLINIGLFTTLTALKKKPFKDDDIPKLILFLLEKLDDHIKEISSFSEYRQEVLLGKLDWTPPHKSERFWRENERAFGENNHSMVKKLIALLSLGNPKEEEEVAEDKKEKGERAKLSDLEVILSPEERIKTVQIALFDLGQYIRFCPRARKVINKIGGKTKIIGLMAHANDRVRNQAIMTTQKLLINKWDHMK